MSDVATETKPDAAEKPNLPAPDGAKPPEAAPAGGGETAPDAGAPSQEPDWKSQFADLKSKYDAISTQVPSLVKGMNEAQQRAAFYEKQMQALAGVQKPQEDPVELWNREAEELEANYRFAEAAPLRSRIAAEVSRRAAREEFQKLNQQASVQSVQANVQRILKDKYGIDPSVSADLSARAGANPEAIAAALALAHDPEAVERVAVKSADERRKAAERAAQVASFGGGSGGRGIPPSGPQNKPRMSFITYSALPKTRKAEIRTMARNGQIELFSVSGRGAAERIETIDPRDLTDE